MAKLTRFGVKSGLVVGAAYYSSTLGVWQGSDKSEVVFKDAYKLSSKYVSDIPVEMPELPRASALSTSAKDAWNYGVLTSIKFLSELPQHTSSLASKSYKFLSSLADAPSK